MTEWMGVFPGGPWGDIWVSGSNDGVDDGAPSPAGKSGEAGREEAERPSLGP